MPATERKTIGVDPLVFRYVIGHFATGVTIITTREGETDFGVTVSAVTSLSLEPPMLLVCLNRTSRTQAAVKSTGRFAVNILGLDQIELAELFATPRDDKFAGLDPTYGPLGDPLIPGAIAHVECEVA